MAEPAASRQWGVVVVLHPGLDVGSAEGWKEAAHWLCSSWKSTCEGNRVNGNTADGLLYSLAAAKKKLPSSGPTSVGRTVGPASRRTRSVRALAADEARAMLGAVAGMRAGPQGEVLKISQSGRGPRLKARQPSTPIPSKPTARRSPGKRAGGKEWEVLAAGSGGLLLAGKGAWCKARGRGIGRGGGEAPLAG